MYDLNGDGCISRGELGEVISAVHELMGRRPSQPDDDVKAREQVNVCFLISLIFLTTIKFPLKTK